MNDMARNKTRKRYFGRKMCVLINGSLLLIMLAMFGLKIGNGSAKKIVTIDQDKAFPSAYDLYRADDPWRELKLAAEQEMGLYLVEPPRRHASEITEFSNQHLHFHIWRPLTESKQTIWSTGVGWLVFGRIKYSRGAQQLFSDIPDLKRITISFHEVERPGQKGRRRSKKPDRIHNYLTLSLTRKDFEKIDLEAVKSCSRVADCDRDVRSMITLVKFNSRYIKRRLR